MSYTKQTWTCGDEITAEKLNHIEDGIADNEIEYVKDYVDPDTNQKTTGVVAGSVDSTSASQNIASGSFSFAEGVDTTASEFASHAEGVGTTASGEYSHAEGYQTTASGGNSHAEGQHTTASGGTSHAEGTYTTASSANSHAEGNQTTASGYESHAQNLGTIAKGAQQTAIGKWNVEQGTSNSRPATTDYALIVGNGTTEQNRSNAFAMKWDGTFVFANNTEISPDEFAAMKEGGMVVHITARTGTLEHTIDADCNDILDYLASNKNVWIVWNIGGMVQRIYTPYFFVPGNVANFMGYTVQIGSDGVTVTNITFTNVQVSNGGGTTVKLADTIIFPAPTA